MTVSSPEPSRTVNETAFVAFVVGQPGGVHGVVAPVAADVDRVEVVRGEGAGEKCRRRSRRRRDR